MRHYICTAVTASNGVTKTLIETTQLPATTKAIVGVGAYAIGGAGFTTLENVTGIVEFESVDLPALQPCQIPLEPCGALTSGAVSESTKTWPMDVSGGGSARISSYVTLDLAQTIPHKVRAFYAVEF